MMNARSAACRLNAAWAGLYNHAVTISHVILAGRPAWAQSLEQLIQQAGFRLLVYSDQADYIAWLAENQAALIVVDCDAPGWPFSVTAPKNSPAARRIPVLAVTVDSASQRAALAAGADFALAPGELAARLPQILADHARVQGEAAARQMASQCAEPPPPRLAEAIQEFNAGEYYRQHDFLEAQWMEEDRPVRDLYRAILQVGIAYYQITRGNRQGALKVLLRSLQWLALLPDVCQGVDVAQLREDSARVRAVLEHTNDDVMEQFDLSLLRPVRLVVSPQDP